LTAQESYLAYSSASDSDIFNPESYAPQTKELIVARYDPSSAMPDELAAEKDDARSASVLSSGTLARQGDGIPCPTTFQTRGHFERSYS
jgi:hypothetical protein